VGLVIGPVVGGLDEEQGAAVFRRLNPQDDVSSPIAGAGDDRDRDPAGHPARTFPQAEPWPAPFTAAALLPALVIAG